MSYLYRTGNGRNNIAFTTTANSSTKYLRRTSTGRNNIVWTTIPQGSTYNILNRTGTGRNNIAWGNLNIPKPVGEPVSSTNITSGIRLKQDRYRSSDGNEYGTYYVVSGHIALGKVLSGIITSTNIDWPYINLSVTGNDDMIITKAEWTSEGYNGKSEYYNSMIDISSGTGNLAHSPDTNHSGFNNANKATVYVGSYWITFHISSKKFLGSYGTTRTQMEYSEYKTNIDFNSYKGSASYQTANNIYNFLHQYKSKVVFSTTW